MFAVLHSESLTRATTSLFLTLSRASYLFPARLVFIIQEVSLGFEAVTSSYFGLECLLFCILKACLELPLLLYSLCLEGGLFFSARLVLGTQKVSLGFKSVKSS